MAPGAGDASMHPSPEQLQHPLVSLDVRYWPSGVSWGGRGHIFPHLSQVSQSARPIMCKAAHFDAAVQWAWAVLFVRKTTNQEKTLLPPEPDGQPPSRLHTQAWYPSLLGALLEQAALTGPQDSGCRHSCVQSGHTWAHEWLPSSTAAVRVTWPLLHFNTGPCVFTPGQGLLQQRLLGVLCILSRL